MHPKEPISHHRKHGSADTAESLSALCTNHIPQQRCQQLGQVQTARLKDDVFKKGKRRQSRRNKRKPCQNKTETGHVALDDSEVTECMMCMPLCNSRIGAGGKEADEVGTLGWHTQLHSTLQSGNYQSCRQETGTTGPTLQIRTFCRRSLRAPSGLVWFRGRCDASSWLGLSVASFVSNDRAFQARNAGLTSENP